MKRPFSVVHTSNLANIAKSYSPEKGAKKRKSTEKARTKLKVHVRAITCWFLKMCYM